MSSPQQPWPPGRPTAPDQPHPNGSSATGREAPQGYGVPLGYGSPQASAATQGADAVEGYETPQAYIGPTGELVLNLRKPFGAMGAISPMVVVDGHPVGAAWGRNVFQVPAGVRQVDVAQSYLWTYGRASHPVHVDPGRTSEIFYSGPMATFGFGGAIGAEPQRRPGTGLFIGLMVVFVLLLLLVVLAVVVGNS
ncbi:MAG: hypothetical protein ACRYG2_25125 [Janthinobacterium lividum]